jgi:Cu+-exporting ATPase
VTSEKELRKASIKIVGMTCTSCAQAIERGLSKAEGVDRASVNFATETAYVEYDGKAITEKELVEVVRDTGYDVAEEPQRVTLRIGGMTCASCVQT